MDDQLSGSAPSILPTVLVVEDDVTLQFLIKEQLTYLPAHPVVVSTGPEALDWLEANQADVVVLDLMLPGMDGYEICRRIRQRHSSSVLPILMLSALGEQVEARINGIQAGANDFLAKPYHLKEFLAHVRMLATVKAESDQAQSLLKRYTTRVMREQARFGPELLAHRHRRSGVVMFADLRGFTHLSEEAGTDTMLTVLDEFFDAMLKIVEEHRGTAFDLIGDEFLAAFNVPFEIPDRALRAVEAALAMGSRFRVLQLEWLKTGNRVGIGMGLHSGEVTLGNVGSASLTRYTVVGNVVNIAHRLVDLAEDGQLILSAAVVDELGKEGPYFPISDLGLIALKGIDAPQHLYRLPLYSSLPDSS